METEQLKNYIVPVTLQKALNLSRRLWGRIEWAFIEELGFLQHMTREQIQNIYAKLHSARNTLNDN